MKRTEILDFNSFLTMQEGTNVNMIYTFPMPFFCPNVSNASLTVKHQLKKVPHAPNVAELDGLDNINVSTGEGFSEYSYVINQDNCLVFIVPKELVANDCMAKEFLAGFVISYETTKVAYATTSNLASYNMLVKKGSDRRLVTAYQQISLQEMLQLLPNLANSLDVNITGGYIFEISRDLMACKK